MGNDYPGPERRGLTPLSVKQVARILGFSQQTVTAYLREGLLPGWRIKRSWKIDAVKFRKIVDQMRAGLNPFVRRSVREAPSDVSVAEAKPALATAAPGYPGPERRGLRPITVPWASRVLERPPEEVIALADRYPLCPYKNRRGELLFSPSRFRAFFMQLKTA